MELGADTESSHYSSEICEMCTRSGMKDRTDQSRYASWDGGVKAGREVGYESLLRVREWFLKVRLLRKTTAMKSRTGYKKSPPSRFQLVSFLLRSVDLREITLSFTSFGMFATIHLV